MPKKALIVEDDPNIAELISLYLEKDVFTVRTAGEGNTGLADAKALVEGIPAKIKEAVSKEDAEAMKAQLEAVGATVEIK